MSVRPSVHLPVRKQKFDQLFCLSGLKRTPTINKKIKCGPTFYVLYYDQRERVGETVNTTPLIPLGGETVLHVYKLF